ncbi:PKD domain-containing protein, partial [Ferruginibacter sp. HRS2-29]|uniref:PKD domain-containing protein n=1 Tax=Ferruginibacter sp. HRS2-29 TaxID=2487334 RepID=UPI0020CF85CD
MWKLLRVLIAAFLFSNALNAQTIITYPGTLPSFCAGGQIVLTASNPPAGNFQWQFSSSLAGPYTNTGGNTNTLTVNNAGFYTVSVSSTPVTHYDTVHVIQNPNPIASFTSSPTNQCGTIPVQFTNTSSGATSYTWNFGDPNSGAANSSTAPNPIHFFIGTPGNGPQNFTVTLTATTAANCTDIFTAIVTTRQLPDAKLNGDGYGIYDNKEFFKKCSNLGSDVFDFYNFSTTNTTNTNYQIIWGDGSPDYNSNTFPPPPFSLQHTYPVGTTAMKFIVTGQNGCKDTTEYFVFLGSNPAVGLGNPGNTAICTGNVLTFPITGTATNSPGTGYTVTFNDNTPPLTYTHPAPASVSHTFNLTSCGVTSQGYPNSFSASIQASNPCASSTASVVPIYVSQKASPSFTISPKDTVCVTNNVTFTNTTGSNSDINNGICTPGKSVWKITPVTGWTVASGTLGNDFGVANTSIWISGSNALIINFNTPGNYEIKLLTGNPTCGRDSITKTVCVSAAPIAAFNIDQNIGCAPLTVNTTNISPAAFCGVNKYQWSVTYTSAAGCTPATSGYNYLNGTNANSVNPQFQFTNPGTYIVGLITTTPGGTCSSTIVTRTVVVKDKPNVTLNPFTTICQNQSINPVANVSCYINGATSYVWSFPGGTPATSTAANPGTILYNTPGTYTITLAVSNECGTTTVTRNLAVNPVPVVAVPTSPALCAGDQAGPFTFSSVPAGASFTWTNSNTSIGLAASGTGNIPAFPVSNAGSTPVTAVITVTGSNGLCSAQQSFNITVNPRPNAPVVTAQVSYCLNATASPLTATATGTNTLLWYSVPAGGTGSTTAPVPLTTTAGTTSYYVSQVNTGTTCESVRSRIDVIIRPIPTIGTVIPVNPSTCGSANGSFTITGLAASTSHTVHYLANGNPQTQTINSSTSGTI